MRPGDHYCPKCETYITGNDVHKRTMRHKPCGTPVEFHEWPSELPNLPRWAYLLIFASLVAAFLTALAIAERKHQDQIQKKQDQETTQQFGRMSTSDKVQEAYERLYPIK